VLEAEEARPIGRRKSERLDRSTLEDLRQTGVHVRMRASPGQWARLNMI